MNSRLDISPTVCDFISLQSNKIYRLSKYAGVGWGCLTYITGTRNTGAFYLSMFADQPNFPDTSTQGDELKRFDICTLATLSPKRFLIQSQVWPNSCFMIFSFSSFLSPEKVKSLKSTSKLKPISNNGLNIISLQLSAQLFQVDITIEKA